MGRLIDAEKLKVHYCWWAGGGREMTLDEAKKTFDTIIDVQPTVDAESVRHGRWLRTEAYPHRIYCSECYATFIRNDEFLHLEDILHGYCPNCGAKMYEVVKDGNLS